VALSDAVFTSKVFYAYLEMLVIAKCFYIGLTISLDILYREYTMPSSSPRLPSGQSNRWAFFILDEGKDLASSKYWMKIQRPYVGGADGQEIRDITVIQTVRSN
jgi:hypothetical protein